MLNCLLFILLGQRTSSIGLDETGLGEGWREEQAEAADATKKRSHRCHSRWKDSSKSIMTGCG